MKKSIIGTGVDITEVNRLKKAIEKWGRSFLDRVFTKDELTASKEKVNLYPHLAGRFAAKEAVFKALGDPKVSLKNIQISNDKNGKPLCSILGNRQKDIEIHVSISHVKNYAVANAIVTKAD